MNPRPNPPKNPVASDKMSSYTDELPVVNRARDSPLSEPRFNTRKNEIRLFLMGLRQSLATWDSFAASFRSTSLRLEQPSLGDILSSLRRSKRSGHSRPRRPDLWSDWDLRQDQKREAERCPRTRNNGHLNNHANWRQQDRRQPSWGTSRNQASLRRASAL